MQNSRVCKSPRAFVIVVLAIASLVGSVTSSSPAIEKMKPEHLVARHLESIGPTKERASIKTRIIAGTSQVIFRTPPPGQATGRAVLASEGTRTLIGMSFPSPVYPREELGFNGNSFVAAYVTPGVRSALGNFLMTHQHVFRQGLMGGTLSAAWPLLDVTARNPQLDYAGTKKLENRILHELKYLPRGGSDLQIRLFFDQGTFQHVRTEYERTIAAPTGSREYANVQEREIRYKMVEEFSDFKNEGGLNLPHTYKITLTVDSGGGTFLADWVINLTQFTFNERIDPSSFSITTN
ncbi:MAG: hypothetical protein H0V18_15010 [Pyrinomonadaceae bacterium]|nr:hypothetical protein [Pyrinomonadaceae bacterium]